MYRLLLTCTLIIQLLPCFGGERESFRPVDYVNPFIGTTNFGTTNPGALCPNGLMSVVPFNVMGFYSDCPGYRISHKELIQAGKLSIRLASQK